MKSKRLLSLDALRGFDMLWIIGGEMVIRNLARATNWPVLNVLSNQTNHVKWEGFHFYDLIMPLFLFMASYLFPFQEIGHIFIFGLEQYTGSFYEVLNSIVSLSFVYLIMYWMYKKQTFIKI